MAIAYYGAQISPNMTRTPEGYLICRNVPINRTGDQEYAARELRLDGDPDRLVIVHRYPEDVFDTAAMASFEGKDITQGHPPENLTPENQAAYSKGHIENVRRVGDTTVADLFIKDATLASDVENGVVREVSCGYLCDYVPDGDGYKQQHIRGNHVAVVPRGRAGHDVAIKDAATEAEKGRKTCMSKFAEAILAAFGMAAKDASEEELTKLVTTTATALDAAPAEPAADPSKDKAPEAEPAKKPTEDEMVKKAPKGDDLGSKLDRIIEMLEAKERGGHGEHPLHDESDLDKMVKKLTGGEDPEAAVTVPAEEMEDASCMSPEAKDAAVSLLKKVRPIVAGMKDPAEKARVVDAMLSTIKGPDTVGAIMKAAQDSARKTSEDSRRTNYEKACAEAESAYAAFNPHKKKEG
jgi:uncharacterized protein conserved in bacteria (DUF2213)